MTEIHFKRSADLQRTPSSPEPGPADRPDLLPPVDLHEPTAKATSGWSPMAWGALDRARRS